MIVGVRSKGRTSECVCVSFCDLFVFGQHERGVFISTMPSSVHEWAPLRGCHSHYLSSSRASSVVWIHNQITGIYMYCVCVFVCDHSVSSVLTSLATRAGFGRRVAVVKLCCKSVLKYAFFAQGLALYVHSSLCHPACQACLCCAASRSIFSFSQLRYLTYLFLNRISSVEILSTFRSRGIEGVRSVCVRDTRDNKIFQEAVPSILPHGCSPLQLRHGNR